VQKEGSLKHRIESLHKYNQADLSIKLYNQMSPVLAGSEAHVALPLQRHPHSSPQGRQQASHDQGDPLPVPCLRCSSEAKAPTLFKTLIIQYTHEAHLFFILVVPLLELSCLFSILRTRQSPNFQTFKEPKNRFQGTNSARLCSLAGWYDNSICLLSS
jgi:hypothetical protein